MNTPTLTNSLVGSHFSSLQPGPGPTLDFTADLHHAGIQIPHGVKVSVARASEAAQHIRAFLDSVRRNPADPAVRSLVVALDTGIPPSALRGAIALMSRGVKFDLPAEAALPENANWAHYLVQSGAEPPQGFADTGESLSLADRFKLLAQAGFDLDARADAPCSPFEQAVLSNNTEALAALRQVLPERDLGRCEADGSGLIHLAASHDADATLQALMEAGVPHDQPGQHRVTPLHLAARNGCMRVLERLLQREGVDVNVTRSDGATPLHLAAKYDQTLALRALLNAGANPAATACLAATPLHMAAASGAMEALSLLLEAAPNAINACARLNSYGRSFEAMFFEPVRWPEDQWASQNFSLTPVSFAAAGGQVQALRTLLAHPECNRDLRSNDGFALLVEALTGGGVETARILINEYGARVPVLRHVAHLDAGPRHDARVRTMLSLGLGVGYRSNEEALHYATLFGFTDIAQALLNVPGIKTDDKSMDGRTPLTIARERGHTEIINLLTAHAATGSAEPAQAATSPERPAVSRSFARFFCLGRQGG